ncbi:hypothetical protein [Cytobacillus purgationiresistens]|uniref:Uncharacterized protein n=1 Tax=Cytobacillus purgationiresistens TaxID=863449 RepID=A0ABU0AME4_9BACI|nr:hypothetical protein [Cytobacillus purgationiresistens]MDQ0271220.1 hypothetical protein [Cytobacillus purgationiresistens]
MGNLNEWLQATFIFEEWSQHLGQPKKFEVPLSGIGAFKVYKNFKVFFEEKEAGAIYYNGRLLDLKRLTQIMNQTSNEEFLYVELNFQCTSKGFIKFTQVITSEGELVEFINEVLKHIQLKSIPTHNQLIETKGIARWNYVPPLVGLKEFAEVIGWDKARLSTKYARQREGKKVRPPLPVPIQVLASSPIWTLEQAQNYRIKLIRFGYK